MTGWFFLIGQSTAYKIIHEVTRAIVNNMQEEYVKFPETEQEWLQIADGFLSKYHLCNCVGPVDSKQCLLFSPPNSGVKFKNRNNDPAITLMATCDAYRRFTWASIGGYGKYELKNNYL